VMNNDRPFFAFLPVSLLIVRATGDAEPQEQCTANT